RASERSIDGGSPGRPHQADSITISTKTESHSIARMFMPFFECELGDARFVEFTQAFRDHAIVLFLGRAREGQIEAKTAPERESDSAIFGRVRSREKAAVIAILHIFAIGFEYAR